MAKHAAQHKLHFTHYLYFVEFCAELTTLLSYYRHPMLQQNSIWDLWPDGNKIEPQSIQHAYYKCVRTR